MTLRQALAGAPSWVSRRDLETLALHVLRRDRAWLLAHPDAEVSAPQQAEFMRLVERRARHEPLQYITGLQEFFGLDLCVTPAVLIPRPETEHLVEAILHWAQRQTNSSLQLLDVGTGSGAIALALAAHSRHASVTALDISPAALDIAQNNARRLGLTEHVRFIQSDLLLALEPELRAGRRFDAIASNPPYVPLSDAPSLAAEVREHEPADALFAGEDGMHVYRRLIPAAWAALRPGGLLAMEFGFGQREAMLTLFAQQPKGTWLTPKVTEDLQGIPRVVEVIRTAH